MTHTLVTAPTQFIEANGIRFAYRRFGKQDGVPLLFLQHYRGGMDHWDPTLTDGFAKGRPVILFDNAGVASSSGQTPNTIDPMAEHATDFIHALGLSQVDLLGFSIGGYVAQALTLRHPQLVRRLMLVGTGPQAGEPREPSQDRQVREHADSDQSLDDFLYLFFSPSATSQAAGRAFWERRHLRKNDVDPPTSPQTMAAQRGVQRIPASARRTICGVKDHHPADAGRQWKSGRHDSDDQFVHAFAAHPQCAVDHLSRCGPRITISVP
jgi:pimeloyl-ACP methyl ester carboxylesterase